MARTVNSDSDPQPSRCFGDGHPLYADYHDFEWGIAVHGESALLERLALEGFQSGLSWLTILRKRPAFREVFCGFDPDVVAAFTPADVERLLADARIVRNRRKIEATITNARAVLALHESGETLDGLVWSYAPGAQFGDPPAPRPTSWDEVPSATPASRALAKALKRRGFVFIGPTTAYAAMQACGLVNDHLATCHSVTNKP